MEKISMRGHHLICLNFFTGEGYDREFVDNLYNIIEKTINKKVLIVEGIDDICKKCPFNINNACKDEEEINLMDKKALELLRFKVDEIIRWGDIGQKLPEIFVDWYNLYCIQCSYKNTCSKTPLFKIFINK